MSVYAVVRFLMDTPPDMKHLRPYSDDGEYLPGEPMTGWEEIEILSLRDGEYTAVSYFQNVVNNAAEFFGNVRSEHDYRYTTGGEIRLDDRYKPFLSDFVDCYWVVEIAAYEEGLSPDAGQRLTFAVLSTDEL